MEGALNYPVSGPTGLQLGKPAGEAVPAANLIPAEAQSSLQAEWQLSKLIQTLQTHNLALHSCMHPFAFPQKAWPRLGGGGVPPWGPSME